MCQRNARKIALRLATEGQWKVTQRSGGVATAWERDGVTIAKETRRAPSSRGLKPGARFAVRVPGGAEYGALTLEGAQEWADAQASKP